jgi:hypothetical protein
VETQQEEADERAGGQAAEGKESQSAPRCAAQATSWQERATKAERRVGNLPATKTLHEPQWKTRVRPAGWGTEPAPGKRERQRSGMPAQQPQAEGTGGTESKT